MKQRKFISILLAFAIANTANAQCLIEQNQTPQKADFGDNHAQSFILPAGAAVDSIQLHIPRAYSGGGSFRIDLWEATGPSTSHFGRIGNTPIATGSLDGASLSETPDWVSVNMETPYQNDSSSDIFLVFDLVLLTSGRNGFNDYSYSQDNPYSQGQHVFWNGNEYVIRDGEDLAFRICDGTVRPPPPEVIFQFNAAVGNTSARVRFTIEDAIEDMEYIFYSTDDLSKPLSQWQKLTSRIGFGHHLTYTRLLPSTLPPKQFYYVKVVPR